MAPGLRLRWPGAIVTLAVAALAYLGLWEATASVYTAALPAVVVAVDPTLAGLAGRLATETGGVEVVLLPGSPAGDRDGGPVPAASFAAEKLATGQADLAVVVGERPEDVPGVLAGWLQWQFVVPWCSARSALFPPEMSEYLGARPVLPVPDETAPPSFPSPCDPAAVALVPAGTATPGWHAVGSAGKAAWRGWPVEDGRLRMPVYVCARGGFQNLMRSWLDVHGRRVAESRVRLERAIPKLLAAPGQPVSIDLVGDVMLARGVGRLIAAQGADAPWRNVADTLGQADYVFANLESPTGTGGFPIPHKGIWFRADPQVVDGLLYAHIGGVSLANNHILDYGEPVLLQTMDILRSHGIGYAGAGLDLAAARAPLLVDIQGVRVAFLAYSTFADLVFSRQYPRPFAAADDRAGVAPARVDYVQEDVARARGEADVVIVAFHWGVEYTHVPDEQQVELAHAAIAAGADVVVGTHPHALQGIEYYKNGLIFYSLGNFVMDQVKPVTVQTVIARLYVDRQGVSGLQVIPGRIVDSQPEVLSGADGQELLAELASFPVAAGGR